MKRRPLDVNIKYVLIGSAVMVGLIVLGMVAGYFWIPRSPDVNHVTVVTKQAATPVFRVETYEVTSTQFAKLSEKKAWYTGGGTYTMFYTFDATVVFGVTDPTGVSVERDGDVVRVKVDTVRVSVIHAYVKDQRFEGGSQTSILGPQTISFGVLFDGFMRDAEDAALTAMTEANWEEALLSFKASYDEMCRAVGLTVEWI